MQASFFSVLQHYDTRCRGPLKRNVVSVVKLRHHSAPSSAVRSPLPRIALTYSFLLLKACLF